MIYSLSRQLLGLIANNYGEEDTGGVKMVMTMETAKVGGLACSAALLVLTDNDGMSESQPTLTMMSTIVMRIVRFYHVTAQEKLNCLCDGNDGVLSERLLEPNRWNVGIAVKELLRLFTTSTLSSKQTCYLVIQ